MTRSTARPDDQKRKVANKPAKGGKAGASRRSAAAAPKTSRAKPPVVPADQTPAPFGVHGARRLPSVRIDAYNLEVKDDEGFVGDQASGRAFRSLVEEWRKRIRTEDGKTAIDKGRVKKSDLDKLLSEGGLEAAGLIMSAIEDYAQALAAVIRRYLGLKSWEGTQRIVIGGGLRDSRIGEIAVGRAWAILQEKNVDISLAVIRYHPDEAGLVGCAHLAPAWALSGYDAFLAVDIGGSNIRCGIVELRLGKAADLSAARVFAADLWRHRDDDPSRGKAVKRLVAMLKKLLRRAKQKGLNVAPFIGIGCPGVIEEDGTIDRGAQNLPGDWTSESFHLPRIIAEELGEIGGHAPVVILHNDAVVQGLSETPFMQDIDRWGVLTIGTGLGNARFTNSDRGKR